MVKMTKMKIIGLYLSGLVILFGGCHNSVSENENKPVTDRVTDVVLDFDTVTVDSPYVYIPKVNLISDEIQKELQNRIVAFFRKNNYDPKKRMIDMHFSYQYNHALLGIKYTIYHRIAKEEVEHILGCFTIEGYDVIVFDKIPLTPDDKRKLFTPLQQSIKMDIDYDGTTCMKDGASWLYALNDSLQPIPFIFHEQW